MWYLREPSIRVTDIVSGAAFLPLSHFLYFGPLDVKASQTVPEKI